MEISNIIHHYKDKCELVLDVACGTGSLATELAKLGYEVIGVDPSPEMLAQAQAKNAGLQPPVLYLCQPAEGLNLYGTVDVALCTLDSINHLARPAQLQKALERIALFLEPGGLFLFDANTLYKHQKILADQVYVQETENLLCLWRNQLRPDGCTVDIMLDFFQEMPDGSYNRTTQQLSERAYSTGELEDMLTRAGLRLLQVTDEDGTPPRPDSQRLFYIAIKD